MSVEETTRLDDKLVPAFNAHDVERYVALCADDIVWHDVANPEPFRGKEGVRQYLQAWIAAFPDFIVRQRNRLVTEDAVAVEIEFSGTNSGPIQMAPGAPAIPATGQKVSGVKGTYFARFRGGKLVEISTYPDVAGMMMQLGLMPGPEG